MGSNAGLADPLIHLISQSSLGFNSVFATATTCFLSCNDPKLPMTGLAVVIAALTARADFFVSTIDADGRLFGVAYNYSNHFCIIAPSVRRAIGSRDLPAPSNGCV
jgi:hypothetical protein